MTIESDPDNWVTFSEIKLVGSNSTCALDISDGGGVQMVAGERPCTPELTGHETATPPSASCPRCLAHGCHHPACPNERTT